MKKLFENWRKTISEGKDSICNYRSTSEGWILPTGEFFDLSMEAADTHSEFARKYLRYDGHAYEEEKEKFKQWENKYREENKYGRIDAVAFLINELNWVRVSNAFVYEGPSPHELSDGNWSRIVSRIAELIDKCPPREESCMYEWAAGTNSYDRIVEPNPQRFITALRRKGKIAPSLTAQFRETKEKENLQELQVMGDRESAKYVVAWRGHVWLFPNSDLSMMKRSGPFSKAPDTIYDLRNDLEEEGRQDVLLGEIDGEDLRLMSSGSYVFDPQSSILIKKLVKALGLRGVERQSQVGDDYEDEFTNKHSIEGKVPEIVYHGTTTKYLPGIMKTGLQPGAKPTNYDSVEHPGAVFFASRFDEAWLHALHTTSKVGSKGWSEPVVIALRIPDPAKLSADYDVAVGSGGDEETFGYVPPETRQAAKKYGPKMKGKSMALSQEFGIYGYAGRIPAKFIQSYFLVPNVEETGKEPYEFGKSDISEITPREMKIYLETKEEFGYGYTSYEDIEGYDDDEEELDESEEKYLMNSWRKSLKT